MPELQLDPDQARQAAQAVRELSARCAGLASGRALRELAEALPGGPLAEAARQAGARLDAALTALGLRLDQSAQALEVATDELVEVDARLLR